MKPRMFLLFVVVLPLLLSTALLLELSPSQTHRVHRVFMCVEGSSGCVCVCVYSSIGVQCSELVFSKEKLGRVNNLELVLGFGEPPSCPEPSPTARSKESLESLEGALLLR